MVGEEERAVVLHDAEGVGAGADFGEAIAGVMDIVEVIEQLAEGVIGEAEVAHVYAEDLVFEEVKIVLEALAVEVAVVGVPADADVRVVGDVHDGADMWREGSARAMDLEADLLSVIGGELADFS